MKIGKISYVTVSENLDPIYMMLASNNTVLISPWRLRCMHSTERPLIAVFVTTGFGCSEFCLFCRYCVVFDMMLSISNSLFAYIALTLLDKHQQMHWDYEN